MTPHGQLYGYVYQIRNAANGKVYIGKTTKSIRHRWLEHLQGGAANAHLQNALRKYGRAGFAVTELGRAFSCDELNEMEVRSIRLNDSTDPRWGYNKTLGGDGAPGYRHTLEVRELCAIASREAWSDARRSRQSEFFRSRWNDGDFRSLVITRRLVTQRSKLGRKKNSEAQLRPQVVAAKSEAAKAQWAQPEFRQLQSSQGKAQWDDPERRKKQVAAYNTPEAKAKKAAANRRRWQTPGYKARVVERTRLTKERNRIARDTKWLTESK